MPVRIIVGEDMVSVFLSGEIGHHNVKAMRAEIDQTVERVLPRLLRLDFGGVEFMDSSGIGLILGRYRLIEDLQGRLELCSLPPHIAKVVHLAGIDHLLAQNSTGPKEDEQYV